MRFVFPDLNEHEADIVANFLDQENIIFKTYRHTVPLYIDCEDDEPYDFMDIFNIVCNTDLAHYDFVKKITDKKIKTIRDLDRIYYTKEAKKRVSTRKKTPNRNRHNS